MPVKGKSCLFFILIMRLFIWEVWAIDEENIERFKWKDLEVVYIEDERFPTYYISLFFADGALADRRVKGETKSMFELLKSGTRRFSQKDIADNLEFFGVSASSSVTHEYSVYSFSGLAKDVVPTTKKICHLFSDATYPKVELKKYKKSKIAGLRSLVNNHGGLASRAFREISLQRSPYSYPVGGKIKDVRRLKRQHLKKKLTYFNNQVKKRIYLTGPRNLLNIKNIVLNECGWKGQANFVRNVNYKSVKRRSPRVVLVTVPKANQAQIRIGRLLNRGEFGNTELLSLSSEYLGGGFTSKLMRELRVKRGLTYGVSASAGGQKEYGRAVISTFTKNETVGEVLGVTKDVVEKLSRKEFPVHELNRAKGSLAGGYPFQFEKTSAFLGQLMFLDHKGKSFRELQLYPEKVRAFSSKEVAKNVGDIFGWEKQTIVVLGNKNLINELKAFGNVEAISYKDYL